MLVNFEYFIMCFFHFSEYGHARFQKDSDDVKKNTNILKRKRNMEKM